MSTRTQKLGLFKYDTVNDAALPFDLNVALNDNWDIIDNLGSGRNIGETVSSTIPLIDAGLHLLDGSLIQGDGIYSAFVTAMAAIYETNPELFCTEQEWQQSITDYGVCGKFVYDSVNNTLRLQKFYSAERYLIASSSSGTEWYRIYSDGWCEQGGVYTSGNTLTFIKPFKDTNYNIQAKPINWGAGGVALCAVKTSTTYATLYYGWSNNNSQFNGWWNSTDWQACGYIDITDYVVSEKYEYIVIANSTKTNIEVDIDEVATDLNGKVDKSDLSEIQCIVETYQNGTSGYRIYSDGYCEQWGKITGYSGWQTQAVTFLKPFKDMNYNITACHTRRTGSAYNDYSVSGVINPTTTGMSLNYYGTDTTGTIWWKACGYIEV